MRRRGRRVTPPVGRYAIRARAAMNGYLQLGEGGITADVLDGQRLQIRLAPTPGMRHEFVDVVLDFRRVGRRAGS